MVLASKEVDKQLKELGVVKMKADWTKKDPVITEELSKFGRNSVPLYVFYSAQDDQAPTILPQVLTPDVVMDHIQSQSETKEIVLKS
jgi:thiol:disulfide interchange protein DsbD